jgi:hypothetical protein
MLFPNADKVGALLKAPDTPGDNSNEASAKGENTGSTAGRERGEGSGTFPPPVDLCFKEWKTRF